jgi:hypothetical protein
MEKLFATRVINTNDLFSDDLIEARALYLHAFNGLPSNFFIGSIDGEKAFAAFSERYCDRITQTYRYQWYDSKKKEAAFSTTSSWK